jgi:CBS domain containing-hemolysin-like protein
MHKIANGTYTRLPVYRNSIDNIVGILHAKDLVLHYIEHGSVESVEQVMRPVLQVPESINANRLLSQLRSKHTQQAMVMDEFGGVEGLITLEDILAEVFGDINGESKLQPERLPDGKVRLPGLLHLDDAQPWIGILWNGESDTVGGHVMDELGHIPVVGEYLIIDGVYVEVESLDDRMIASLIVTPLRGDEEEEHNG